MGKLSKEVQTKKAKKPKPLQVKRPKRTSVEYISVAGASAKMSPVGLHFYAKDFLDAAKAAPVPATLREFAPARPYLVCHALELALKAFLSLKGFSLMELAEGVFGHRLENILARAEQHGLAEMVTLSKDQLDQIRRGSNYYSEKVFEYPAVGEAMQGYPGRPNVEDLLGAAEALVAALAEPCLNAE